MAHSNIEIQYDSRPINVTNTGISQTVVVDLLLDDMLLEHADPSYTYLGSSDDVVATQYAYAVLPNIRYFPTYSGNKKLLILTSIKMEQRGNRHWRATAEYSYNVNTGSGGTAPDVGKNTLPFVKINFNIGGGTKNIKKSIEVLDIDVSDEATILDPLSYQGAIGVTEDSVEGTEVPDSDLRLQITAYYLPEFVDFNFVKTIKEVMAGKRNTGSYNDKTYLGAEKGEVQLRAASGGGTVVDIIPITFDFHLGFNIEEQEDFGFPKLTMLGHDLLDYVFLHEFDETSGKILLRPTQRVVHKIATPEDYDRLELPL